jgi:hypothetical protein
MYIRAKILTPDGIGEVVDYDDDYVWVYVYGKDWFTQKYRREDCRLVI